MQCRGPDADTCVRTTGSGVSPCAVTRVGERLRLAPACHLGGWVLDLATLLGLIIGLALIIGSMMMGGSLDAFINGPGLAIVVGGTFAAMFITEALGNVLGAFKVVMNAFINKSKPPEELVPVILELGNKARKEGIVALEGAEIDDPFLARGIRLGVDGLSPDVIEASLESELAGLKKRHERGAQIFKFMATTAPSMGMIGTLIGLVQMLGTLDDPGAIGPAMAVALLTTLYGAILAFLMFGPLADKLGNRSAEEAMRSRIAIVGVASILNGDNSLVTQSKLMAYLGPKERAKLESSEA